MISIPWSVSTANGQEYPMLHYTINNGLPSNTVYSMYRDSKGFLWIATEKGIARYNGIKFDVFTTFNGLPDNEVLFFQEDLYQRLWIGTYNGELCYYKNDTFHTAANTPFLSSIHIARAFTKNIFTQYDSSIDIEFSDGLSFINIKNDQSRSFQPDDTTKNSSLFTTVVYTYKKSPDKYAIVLYGKTIIIDTNNKILSQSDNSYRKVPAVFSQNQDQTYLIYDKLALYRSTDTFRQSNNNNARALYHDGKDMFIISRDGNAWINDQKLLINGQASSITQDISGNYWVSTTDNGIYVLNVNFRKTRLFKNAYTNTNIKAANVSWDGSLLFANLDALYSLKNNSIVTLVDYKKDFRIKIPFRDNALFFFDRKSNFYSFRNHVLTIVDNEPGSKRKITELRTANVDFGKSLYYVGRQLYLTIYNAVYHTANVNAGSNGLLDLYGTTGKERIFYARANYDDSSFWYSTIGGTYRIDNNNNQDKINNIAFKYFDFCGKCLVGYTHNNKLLVCRIPSKEISVDTIKPENCIWDKFYKLDEYHLLISTNNQYRLLTIFPKGSVKTDSITTLENEFVPLHAEAICADTVNFFFFKDTSVISFNIKDLLAKSAPPKIFFSYIRTNKKTYPVQENVEIPFKESGNINISFSTLSFSGKKILHQYSVSQNDQDNWRDVTGDEINLVRPDYGSYTIKVRAKTRSSEYSEPVTFELNILSPYWAKSWFIGLCVCIVLGILGLIIFVTRRLVLEAAKKRHQHVELELKSVYSQLNPHFIFNSLNAAMYLIKIKQLDEAYRHIHKFSHLLRAYIKSSRNRFISLNEETNNLRNYIELQQARFTDRFDYEIIVSPQVDTDASIPSLLIQPLVENAITHGFLNKGTKGHLKIEFTTTEDQKVLICVIDDDGVGRNHSAKVKYENTFKEESYGSDLIRDLIGIINRSGKTRIDIEYIDKIAPLTGTIVKLNIKTLTK